MTKVLITRPEPDACDFAEQCRRAGLDPIIAPVMKIKLHSAPVSLEGVGALAFTSGNGARAFAANSKVRDLTVFAVGKATADAARKEGFRDVRIAGGDVDALALSIIEARGDVDGEVLHIAGTKRAGDLAATLQKESISARRAVLYEARAAAELPIAAKRALSENTVAWAALFSPRTANLFIKLVSAATLEGSLAHIRAACLSDAVATVAQGAEWAAIEIADRRDAEGMIELMRGA